MNLKKLAWNLLKICANLFEQLKKVIFSEEFLSRHRKSPRDFSRNRLLPFSTVILFLTNLLKNSLGVELKYFFKMMEQTDIPINKVSDSAFCQARKKLRHEAFIELNQVQTSFFYEQYPLRTWFDFRLLAIDGSTLDLPNTADIVNRFGGIESVDNRICPKARVSQLFDVRNKITLDAAIAPYTVGERKLAIQHLSHLTGTDLVLLDRGYSAFWFFAMLCSTGAHFCCRMNIDHWSEVERFYQSGAKEAIVRISPCEYSNQICNESNLATDPLTVRLIRIELEKGTTEILMTTLLDSETFPYELFSSLYHERWGVEESYKVIKHRIQMENYTGKSAESIFQDFHARIFTLNLTSIMVHPIQDELNEQKDKRKYKYQVNFTKALCYMKDSIVQLFTNDTIRSLIEQLFTLFRCKPEPIRPNRKYSRKRKIRDRQTYSFPYKATR